MECGYPTLSQTLEVSNKTRLQITSRSQQTKVRDRTPVDIPLSFSHKQNMEEQEEKPKG